MQLLQQKHVKDLWETGALWTATPSPHTPKPQRKAKAQAVPFDLQGIDDALTQHLWNEDKVKGLQVGALHDWFSQSSTGESYPPHTLLTALVGRALQERAAVTKKNSRGWASAATASEFSFLVWIGKRSWPSPFILSQVFQGLSPDWRRKLLPRCLFLDPKSEKERKWALLTALSSPAVTTVVADTPKLTFQESVKLSRAAARGGTLGLLLRDPQESNTPSAASTKWKISTEPSPSPYPRWCIELLAKKGTKPQKSNWIVECSYGEKVSLHLPQRVVDSSRTQENSSWRLAG